MAAPMSTFRVVEFYSGIGGMHYAVTASKLNACIVAAIDVNDLANKVYKRNFPGGNLMQRNIQSITKTEFTQLDADIFLMSPPCQPFTRVGLKGDCNDPRTQSFLHVLEILPNLPKMPGYILVENVKGFETSTTRNRLIQTLQKCSYIYQEFLLSPTHFGIPNQRLRYFLLARRHPLEFNPARISKEELQILLQHRVNGDRAPAGNTSVVSRDDGSECGITETDSAGVLKDETLKKLSSSSDDSTIGMQDLAGLMQELTGGTPTCTFKPNANATDISDHHCGPAHLRAVHESPHLSCCSASPGSRSATCECKKGRSCPAVEDKLRTPDQGVQEVKPLSLLRDADESKQCSCKVVPNYLENLSLESTERLMLPECKKGRCCPPVEDKLSTPDQGVQLVKPQSPLRDAGESKHQCSCRVVADYLENLSLESTERLMLPDKLLKRFARIVDVVTPGDRNTRCFTKAYGHYVEGTGSMVQMNTAVQGHTLLKNCSQHVELITENELEQMRNLKIRYFTPREIANLHHFPKSFDFPAELSVKQRYRVLGNSLNIHVVAVLLRYMVTESPP